MTETALPSLERPRRFHFDWLLPALVSPRRMFARIAEQNADVWLTPILVLIAAALLNVIVAGPLKQAAAQNGQVQPPGYQYYTPEQQAQLQQALAATSGPVFVYVFPAILNVLGIWVGWLVLVGILHLALTLLGGRGSTRSAMNVVAWASLPFAVRDLVRMAGMWINHQLIAQPGLSGFAPTDGRALSLLLIAVLGLVDIYLIWHVALLILGVRASNGLSGGKAIGGVLIAVGVLLALQALPGFLLAKFGALQVIQPFFF